MDENKNDCEDFWYVNENELGNLFELYNTNKFTPDENEYLKKTQELLEYIRKRRSRELSDSWTESDTKIITKEFIYLCKGNELLGSGSKSKRYEGNKLQSYFLLCVLVAILTHQAEIVDALLLHEIVNALIEIYNKNL